MIEPQHFTATAPCSPWRRFTSALIIVTPLLILHLGLGASTAHAANDILWFDQCLEPGDHRQSANGHFTLRMHSDGNLVLYNPWGPIWATNTADERDNIYEACMDDYWELFVTDGDHISWSSDGNGRPSRENFLKVQDDGKLVIYDSRTLRPLAANCMRWNKHQDPVPKFCTL